MGQVLQKEKISGYWLADKVADNWAFNINQQTGVLKLVFERKL